MIHLILRMGLCAALTLLPLSADTTQYTIQSVAGNDSIGDGGLATAALLGQLQGIAMDAAGNLYVSDTDDSRVREVLKNGTIRTAAGSGVAGFSGDGGPATAARLDHPYGLAVDPAGNLYIADLGNAVVRKVSPDGTISTVAGGGTGSPLASGTLAATGVKLNQPRNVAADAAGNLYVSDFAANQVYVVGASGTFAVLAGTGSRGLLGDSGAATLAQLAAPAGIALDSGGSVYIADSGNNRVRKVTRGTISTTFSIGGPTGLAVGATGTLYVAAAAYFGTPIRSIGTVSGVEDVTVDAAGNLYLLAGSQVRKIAVDGTLTTVAGSGAARYYGGDGSAATAARIHAPWGIVQNDLGETYFADSENNRIRKITAGGIMTTFAGTGVAGAAIGTGPALSAQLNGPRGVALDSARNLYVADTLNNRICKITPAGLLTVVTSQLRAPEAVALDAMDGLYVADTGNNRIVKIAPGPVTLPVTDVVRPLGLAVDPAGTVYFSESTRISQFSGNRLTVVQDGLQTPRGIAVTPTGDLVVAETGANRVVLLHAPNGPVVIGGAGSVGFSGDGGLALAAQMNAPAAVAVDGSGTVWVSDSGNERIRTLTPSQTEAPSALQETSVINAASLKPGPVASGEIITVYGTGFDPANTVVLFDGNPATVFYTGQTQVNVLVPAGLLPGSVTYLTVRAGVAVVAAASLNVAASSPALFAGTGGAGQGAVINGDGSYNSASNPAVRGTVVSLYGTGWTGTGGVSVTIGGYDSAVLFAGPAPGFPGLMQVNVSIPAGFLGPGAQALTVTVGGVATQAGVTIALQ